MNFWKYLSWVLFILLLLGIGQYFFTQFNTSRSTTEITSSHNDQEQEKEDILGDEKDIDKKQDISEKNTEITPPPLPKKSNREEKKIFQTAIAEKDIRICNEISSSLQKSCQESILLLVALKSLEVSFCDQITTPEKKTYCRDQTLFKKAIAKKQYSECDAIQNQFLKNRCQESGARTQIMQTTSIDGCKNISSERHQDTCSDFFTIKKIQSPEQTSEKKVGCDAILSPESRRRCFLQNAILETKKTRDITPCTHLAQESDQKTCAKHVQAMIYEEENISFISSGNVEDCLRFSDKEIQNYCHDKALITRATKDFDPSVCNDVVDESQKNICIQRSEKANRAHYSYMAREKKDSKWCQFIRDQETQKSCILVTKAYTKEE